MACLSVYKGGHEVKNESCQTADKFLVRQMVPKEIYQTIVNAKVHVLAFLKEL